jgi:hypothetical protein
MSEATANPAQVFVDAGSSRATAQAAAETAQYYDNLLTATAVSIQATATERAWQAAAAADSAHATATTRAWEVTVTAAVEQTAASDNRTATALAWTPTPNYTSTVEWAAARTYATAQAGEAESVRLAIEREQMTNQVKAFTPLALLFVTFVVAIFLMYQHGRVRVIRRDERGDAPLVLDVIDGVAVDQDRNPYAQGGLRREDLEKLPTPPLALQAGVTERDQMVDLATRGNGSRTGQTSQLMQPTNFQQQQEQRQIAPAQVQILPPEQARPLLGNVVDGIVRDAIEADLSEGDSHE